jgi:hypothetical protein
MRRIVSQVVLPIACAVAILSMRLASHLSAQNPPLSARAVQQSIERGVQFLEKKQLEDGHWDGYPNYGCGQTALVTLALLSSGRSPDAPSVSRAMEYLRSKKPERTYETALQTMVFCAAEPQRDLALIQRNVQWLLEAQQNQGAIAGGWGYQQGFTSPDPSNSQFALLALWEAQRVGIQLPPDSLKLALAYWLRLQQRSGGWSYLPATVAPIAMQPTGSMTSAGIASLLIAEDALQFADAKVQGERLLCCQGQIDLTPVDQGMQWLAGNFSAAVNPPVNNPAGYWYYYLYALERVGRLSGQRFIGNHDWYREGAQELLKRQQPIGDGLFKPEGTEDDVNTNTALALLFLSKGKRQVVIGRLEHRQLPEMPEPALSHRRAVQHLMGHVEKVWKRDLSWQSVRLAEASVADLLEAPVLFLSGREALQWTPQMKSSLKQYIEQGGFLFAEACEGDGCQGDEFEASFRQLMEELFQQPMRKLPPSHPIWFTEARIDPASLPEGFWLYGLEQCCRTSVVFAPRSLSCRWEVHRPYGVPTNLPGGVRGDVENATKIGINVISYATGRELKDKLDAVQIVQPTADLTASLRNTLALPKLEHAGGADDVPRAVPNLLEIFRNEVPTEVSSTPILIPAVLEQLQQHAVVYVHGRSAFEWSETEREALRTWLKRGGVLLGDSVCSSQPFTESIRKEFSLILPQARLQKVPTDHPMLTSQFQGYDLGEVTIIEPATEMDSEGSAGQRRVGPPMLEMLVWEDRVVAIFSPIDLSCALESRRANACKGYAWKDASRIGINMLLYAIYQ